MNFKDLFKILKVVSYVITIFTGGKREKKKDEL